MFKWLKGRGSAPPAARQPAAKGAARVARTVAPPPAEPPLAPAPLPEVVGEGSTEADWSAWEDSMATLDSQFQDLPAAQRVRVRDTRPSQLDDLDPFGGVRDKRGG